MAVLHCSSKSKPQMCQVNVVYDISEFGNKLSEFLSGTGMSQAEYCRSGFVYDECCL